MSKASPDFDIHVDGVNGKCPAGEAWADTRLEQQKIPVLACEGPCIRGEIARQAANLVVNEQPFARACFAEAFFVPHSSMRRWVQESEKVVMIDGCFLSCLGRVLNNLVDEEKIIHFDALELYKKYTDLFAIEDVPEAERIDTAKQVAEKVLRGLKDS